MALSWLKLSLKIAAYIIFVFGVWNLLIMIFRLPSYMVPAPGDVLTSLSKLSAFYRHHTLVTLEESGFGLIIGFAAGFICGLLLRYGGRIGRAINPLIIASQVFPKEALAPLFLVFLGFGVLPKIVISALICFFPIAINTFKGLEATPSAYRKLMHIVGASPWQRFVRCDLPFAAPYIFASLSVSATLSIIGAVVGEFVGSSAGLGHVIRAANADVGTERIYAALIILGAMGSLFYGITLFLGRVLFKRYTQSV